MKQCILFAVFLFAASCLRDDDGNNSSARASVKQYIVLLESGDINFRSIPVFEISDIPELLKYARNENRIAIDTMSLLSSALHAKINTTVGMMALWTVEGTRLDVDRPSANLFVVDQSGNTVPQNKVAGLYEEWWKANRSKTHARLKQISPFGGTGFKWY